MFTLTIQTSNAAFEDYPDEEISRIIKESLLEPWARGDIVLADDTVRGTLRDINGNVVGTWEYVPE